MLKTIFKKIARIYLKCLAKIYIWRLKPEIILIAGTTNRFWIKEEVIAQLHKKFGEHIVRTNPKNFNAEIGLPLSILSLPSGKGDICEWIKVLTQALTLALFGPKIPRYLALDAAFDMPGDMNYLLSIIKPKIAIITNITPIYMENFSNLEEIRQELAKISQNLPKDGFLILNNNDERVKTLGNGSMAQIITYGIDNLADFRGENISKITDGQKFEIVHNGERKEVKINRFGRHHVYAKIVGDIIKNITLHTLSTRQTGDRQETQEQ